MTDAETRPLLGLRPTGDRLPALNKAGEKGFAMKRLVISTLRESYGKDEIRTLSVGDLISLLSDYDEDALVVLSFDNGYTYGGLRDDMFEEEDDSDEDCE